jgi:hypothetical protein
MAAVDLDSEEARASYDRKLVLARPDQHVAWRGNSLPPDPEALVDHIRAARALTRELA